MNTPAFSFSDYVLRAGTRYPYSFYYEFSTMAEFDEAVAWIEERVGFGHDLEVIDGSEIDHVVALGELPFTFLQGVAITIADHDLAFEFRLRWC